MLDKLGRLGDAADDADRLYGSLMVPSALSEWDIGRAGQPYREVARILLGRLSAYLRLHQVSLKGKDTDISTTFLAWLTKECQSNSSKSTKSKERKTIAASSETLSSLAAASSFLSLLQNDLSANAKGLDQTASQVDFDGFKLQKLGSGPLPPDVTGQDIISARSTIADYVRNNRFIVLDKWLERLISHAERRLLQSQSEDAKIDLTDLSIELLKGFYEHKHPQRGTSEAVLKWAPRLSSAVGKPDLWKLIFRKAPDIVQVATSRKLLSKCMLSWSMQHVSQCKEWIMSLDHAGPIDFDYEAIALFLVSCSEQPPAQIEPFSELTSDDSAWANSKDFVTNGTLIAIKSLKQSPHRVTSALGRRNGLPSGFELAFLLARCGKKQLRGVCEPILKDISVADVDSVARTALEVLFLRLYLNFPFWMDLGSAEARTTLMHASETFANSWVDWVSSFDDKIDEMLHAISTGELKCTKQLAEMSRKQPLLILRKLPKLSAILKEDATIDSTDPANQRGAITGQNLSGKRDVKFHGKLVKMNVQHWGYTYTEPLWVSLLDVLSSMPREVLFTCGLKSGLLDLLTVYLQLMSVQLQLLSASKSARLKAKLDGAFTTFKQCNADAWTEWLVSNIGESQVRHLLMSCDFISPQEAMDCAKK